MKIITTIIFTFLLFIINSFAWAETARAPRQKIQVSGKTTKMAKSHYTVLELEKLLPLTRLKMFDPYNHDRETTFKGFYLKSFFELIADTHYKSVKIVAIDGYKVDVPRSDIEKNNLFLCLQDEKGYFSVDRMGPARIMGPANGIINKDLLLKIGVYWVWQVKSFEVIK
jgi:hypothetical protein